MRLSAVVWSAVLAAAACTHGKSADPSYPVANPTGTPGEALATRSTTVSVTVKAVNLATRTLTIQREGSTEPEAITVGPGVRRLAEIAPGDVITAELHEGLLLAYQAVGEPAVEPSAAAATAIAGADSPPGAAVAAAVQATVTVVGLDRSSRVVTLQGPDGNQYKVTAGEKVALDKLKIGDRLLATYAATVAVSAEKGGSKL